MVVADEQVHDLIPGQASMTVTVLGEFDREQLEAVDEMVPVTGLDALGQEFVDAAETEHGIDEAHGRRATSPFTFVSA